MKKYLFLLTFTLFAPAAGAQPAAPAVYLSEARNNPFERRMFLPDTGDTFRYTAFVSSASQPEEAIHVRFEVNPEKVREFNAANGTDYEILPEGSYNLSPKETVIPKGAVRAAAGAVEVTGGKQLEPFGTYLLPVSVEPVGSDIIAHRELSTVYYIIRTVPAPGSIVREQVGRLPSDTQSVFALGGTYLVAVGGDGRLTGYRYAGGSLGKGIPMAGSEHLAGMDAVFNFRDRKLVGLRRKTAEGQLLSFPLGADGFSVGPLEKIFGTSGYNIFSGIVPHGNTLYCLKLDGELMRYGLSDSMEWSGEIRSLGSGWNYPILFGYGDSLIAVDARGAMWKYPLLAGGETGLPHKIGSGWNSYSQIAVLGDELLCVDREGVVWRIKFGTEGFWAL